MKMQSMKTVSAACAALFTVIFFSCGKGDGGRVPVTTRSKEALKSYQQGVAHFEQIQVDKARTAFLRAVEKDTAFAMGYYQLAFIEFEPRKALEYISKAQSLSGPVSEGEKLYIQAYQEGYNGNGAKAKDLYQKITELYPRDRQAHWLYAATLSGEERYAEAAKEYRNVVSIDPAYALGYNMMAYGYMSAGNLEEAEKAVKTYIALRPLEPNPYDTHGEVLRKMGRFDESSASYRKALSMDSTFTVSHRGIGINLALQGKAVEATAEIGTAYEKSRTDAERQQALYAGAFCWILLGDFGKAVAELEKSAAISEKNQDILALNNDLTTIAWIHEEQGKYDTFWKKTVQAKKLVEGSALPEGIKNNKREQFLFTDADHARRLNRLAKARAKAEEYRKAVEAKNDPFNARMVQDLVGSLALAEKRYDDAIRELEKANQRSCHVLFRTAEAYAAKGDKAKAKELFAKVADFNEYNFSFGFLRAKAQKKLESL
jgi:tetratricopeptide (TPR) repeat protein